jgi:hypothetical protein
MASTSNVLPLFWHLASSSKDTRLSASADLVSSVEGFQAAFVPPTMDVDDDEGDDSADDDEEDDDESGEEVDGSDDEEAEEDKRRGAKLDKALARGNAEDVVYCVKRLVRGLGSSRESSRLGFAVALTEVGDLYRISHDFIDDTIAVIENTDRVCRTGHLARQAQLVHLARQGHGRTRHDVCATVWSDGRRRVWMPLYASGDPGRLFGRRRPAGPARTGKGVVEGERLVGCFGRCQGTAGE